MGDTEKPGHVARLSNTHTHELNISYTPSTEEISSINEFSPDNFPELKQEIIDKVDEILTQECVEGNLQGYEYPNSEALKSQVSTNHRGLDIDFALKVKPGVDVDAITQSILEQLPIKMSYSEHFDSQDLSVATSKIETHRSYP